MNTVTFKVEGMHCGGCAQIIQSLLEKQAGVRAVKVSFEDGQARVLHDPQTVAADQLAAAIEKAGYKVKGQS